MQRNGFHNEEQIVFDNVEHVRRRSKRVSGEELHRNNARVRAAVPRDIREECKDVRMRAPCYFMRVSL